MFKKISAVAILLTLLCACQMSSEEHITPDALRSEYLVNPEGIDQLAPRLSWTIKSETRGQKQSAYRVLVASSRALLKKNSGDLWDTGKVVSGQSNQLAYAGKPLRSNMQCFWKVMIWPALSEVEGEAAGKPSAWSAPAYWSMGLLNAEDWQAEWIGLDQAPQNKPEYRAALDGKNQEVIITKAIYGVLDKPEKQVDLKALLQKWVDDGNLLVTPTSQFAGKDPAPGEPKKLLVECTVGGRKVKGTVAENQELDLSIGRKRKEYLPAPYLRKEFKVDAAVKRAVVYATAQGVFELNINGERVGDEYFMPGWTDYKQRIYYRAYDVTEMLETGENAIGAILGDGWFRGNISCIDQNRYGRLIRLKAQLHIEYTDGNRDVIRSDDSWKAAYGPIIESDMQAGEVYDARREMPGWDRAGFDAGAWLPVVTGSNLNPPLEAYPGDPVRCTMELPTLELTEPESGKYVFDLGQNFSGWIRLKVKGNAGDTVAMHFAEMLEADGTVYTSNLRSARATDTYILKGGDEEIWEPHFTFHGFRYVQISGLTNAPTKDSVTGIVTHSDSPISAAFECSNPMVNQLYSNIVWGQRSNYLEVPTDCPQRDERLGWTGDTQVFIRTGCYNQDVSAFFTKWMTDLMDTQNRQGLFGNQAPVFHGHGAAAWACAGIISPWTIYKVYGDTRMIEENYDAMVRYMDAVGKDGLGGRKAHTWGDWLAPGHRPPNTLISAAYHAYTSSLMADMAEAIGKHADAAKYQQQFEDIRTYFQETYVKPDGTIESELQTVYCMALKFDLLTDAQRKQAAHHLVERIKAKDYHLSVGFLGMPILLPTLTDIGRPDLAYRLIQNTTYPSWGYSIEQGATTIWERWNSYSKKDGFGDVTMNSFNHYSLGSCGEWMFRSMLGIESDGAGFKAIEMKPELPALSGAEGGEGITWAKGHYDSIYGRIGSDWKREDGAFDWKISVPANTQATVYIPAKDAASVLESGKSLAQADGVTFLRMEDGRAVCEVISGNYVFRSTIGLLKRPWQASWVGATDAVDDTIVIQKALYGQNGNPVKQADVSKKIQQMIHSGTFIITANNDLAGRDPAYGIKKTLELQYTVNGELMTQSVVENTQVDLSVEAPEVVIIKALYGVKGNPAKRIDVSQQIRQAIAVENYRITADNTLSGRDPAHGVKKTLELEYTLGGKLLKQLLQENEPFDLIKSSKKKSDASQPNQWSCFRKVVHLDRAPKQALARIAADSKYWLWINGELVVFEGQLKRGPTPDDTYYDEVDLSEYLQQGDNTIAVLLWYFGKDGFSHKSSGKAGLIFDAQVAQTSILSGSDWKAMIHPAFGDTGEPHPNYRLPESNIRFDAQKDLLGWQNPGFDDSDWAAAGEYGAASCAPWNELIQRPVPLWKDFGLKEYVNAAEFPKVSNGHVIKAKLPYNAQITPYLKIEGPAGQVIDIRMDNYRGGKAVNVRGEYVTREGVQAYENLGWMNGHEVHYSIPAGFKILALKYRETGYNTEFTGTFECDDEFLNRYRKKALRTLYITMRDTYFDCPDRERAQWWGDMVNEMGEAFYALDPRSNHLAKKGILELANWQRPDHTIFSPVPAGNWNRELPTQMLNSVGYYGFWTYYQYTGDLETIRAVYPAVKRYLSIWKLGKDGLVVPRNGGWLWGDWGKNKDMPIIFNGWYYLALKGQLNMAHALGEAGDIAEIEARMQSIEQNFNKNFWNGEEYRSPDYKGQTDDRVHALAVISGLAKPQQYDAIRKVFQTQEHSSPYMEKYVGEALYQMRFEHDAIARTKKRFKEMTDHTYSTLWEDWKIGGSGGGTINHAWCGGALTLLSQYGAGVSPVTPGYGTYQILPQMGPLKHIKTTVPSVKGKIDLELIKQANVFSLKLNSPLGTTAIVGIPKHAGLGRIQANGKNIWSNGKPNGSLAGLRFKEATEHYITFSVQPGNWTFVAR